MAHAPERTLYNCEWASVTPRSPTKWFKVKPVSAEFLSFMSLYFKNWDLQSTLTPSSTRQWPWAKIQIKLVLIQGLLRGGVSFDPGSRMRSSQMSNYSRQPPGCIHTGLTWEASEILWLAGRGRGTLGLHYSGEGKLRSALGLTC